MGRVSGKPWHRGRSAVWLAARHPTSGVARPRIQLLRGKARLIWTNKENVHEACDPSMCDDRCSRFGAGPERTAEHRGSSSSEREQHDAAEPSPRKQPYAIGESDGMSEAAAGARR